MTNEVKHLLVGERIFLRRLILDDATQSYLEWLSDPEVNQFLETRHNVQTIDSIKNYIANINASPNEELYAICLCESEAHIGNIKLGPIDNIHSRAETSLFIGNRFYWGKGYGAEAVNLIKRRAFQELCLSKLTAGCYSNNLASAKLFLKAGFETEGVLRSHYSFGNEKAHRLCFGHFNPQEHNIRSTFTYGTNFDPFVSAPILVGGVQRSGTSLLGNIVGTLKRVEYEFEPWVWGNLPVFLDAEMIPRRTAKTLLDGHTMMLMCNHVLCRGINLRSTDMSNKGRFIGKKIIETRWKTVNSPEDIRTCIKKDNLSLAFKLVNFQPTLPLFREMFPQGKIVHIVRNPFAVALSAYKKRWHEDDTLSNVETADVRKKCRIKGKLYHFPWWVPDEDLERFLKANPYERSLYCWIFMMDKFLDIKMDPTFLTSKNYFELSYEELISSPEQTVSKLARFLDNEVTVATTEMLQSINRSNVRTKEELELHHLSADLKERAIDIANRLERKEVLPA